MTPDWTPLTRELARWQADGLTLPLWWRDDDAIAPSPALDRLTALSDRAGLPVHLAIIPKTATPALAALIRSTPGLIPLVHGWQHRSHAEAGAKKSEFPDNRLLAGRLADAKSALARLTELLGTPPAPVFVPPWNRIGADMAPCLPALGFAALTTFGPRAAPEAAPGLAQINTHLDPIFWRGTRSLVDPDTLIAQIAADLTARRTGAADNAEPYGLLTHHLVHDAPIWNFTADLLARLTDGPISPFSAAEEFAR